MSSRKIFYKENKNDIIWSVLTGKKGPILISFDKKTIYNLWTDYGKLTSEQKAIIKEEMPFWYDFFERNEN